MRLNSQLVRSSYESAYMIRGLSFGVSLCSLAYGTLEYAIDGKLDHPYFFAVPFFFALAVFGDSHRRTENLERIANAERIKLS